MSKKQLLSRLLQIVVVLVGISFITFFLTYLSPGDPVENMYISMGQMPSEEIVEQTREEMGLNDPFLTQYVRWLGNCLHGGFRYLLFPPPACDRTAAGTDRANPASGGYGPGDDAASVGSSGGFFGVVQKFLAGLSGKRVYFRRLRHAEFLGGASADAGILCKIYDLSGNQRRR